MNNRKKILLIALLVILALLIGGALFFNLTPSFGARSSGDRLAKIQRSANYRGSRFVNPVPTRMSVGFIGIVRSSFDFAFGGQQRTPPSPLHVQRIQPKSLAPLPEGEVAVTWLGHSTALLRIGDRLLLTDPVFSSRVSPISWAGPKRFNAENPISIEALPRIDAVLISHDHFDHLDYRSILALKSKTDRFFVPLGVGAHLEKWGVEASCIVELDWWESAEFENLRLTAAPTRHFSGRAVLDSFKTLWAGWAIEKGATRIFFGGDSGYFEGFKEIGERLGPFDLTMLESGAYSRYWPDLHMMPEQTIQAHLDLRGSVLLPIHWGKFNLSLHAWTEPIERLTAEAESRRVEIATPRIGQTFRLGGELPRTKWWRPDATPPLSSPQSPTP